MKLLFDLFPVILFFVAYKVAGVYTATAVAVVASFLQIGWLRLKGRKIEPALWLSLVVIVVFGGATLFLHDEMFIKWKPTVLYVFFAVGMISAERLFGKNPMRALMGSQISLTDALWRRLTLAWAGFFAGLAVLNLYVAQHFSTDAWVNFKLFGVTGLLLAFVFVQALFLARHADTEVAPGIQPPAPAPAAGKDMP